MILLSIITLYFVVIARRIPLGYNNSDWTYRMWPWLCSTSLMAARVHVLLKRYPLFPSVRISRHPSISQYALTDATSTRRAVSSSSVSQRLETPLGVPKEATNSASPLAPPPQASSPTDGQTLLNMGTESGPRLPPNGHVLFYREILPAMIPIFLLGSAVYIVRTQTSSLVSLDVHFAFAP